MQITGATAGLLLYIRRVDQPRGSASVSALTAALCFVLHSCSIQVIGDGELAIIHTADVERPAMPPDLGLQAISQKTADSLPAKGCCL